MPRFVQRALAPIVVSLLLCGCRSADTEVEVREVGVVERVDFGGPSSYVFCGQMYVGGSPDAEQVELAARRGVELVLAVGPVGSGLSEAALERARWLELEVAQVHFDGAQPTDADVSRALELLAAPRRGRTLLHSPQGGWAASLLAIARVEQMGVEPAEALAEARHAGLDPGPQESFTIERLGLGTFAR
jgi:hypothetical protein